MRFPWIPALLVASPVPLLAAGFAASGIFDLAGADCTGPNSRSASRATSRATGSARRSRVSAG